ncbi:MAG: tyrosine-type recombinase/integrase [Bryobacteraceae bacterium]
MKKRTYGTGTLRQIPSGKWLLEYKPKWAPKRLSKTVEGANQKTAQKLLTDWVTELDKQTSPSVEVSIAQLIDLHIADMRMKGRDTSSIATVEQRCRKHLVPYFADIDFANPLRKAAVKKYANVRLKAGAQKATVNRELAALRRAIRLGIEEELISVAPPKIEKLPENNTRVGFVDDERYSAIAHHLPEHQRMLWCFAYRTGVRRGELLKIRLEWLLPYWGEPEPFIKVPGFDAQGNRITKSGKPHTIPLYHPELRAFVEMALAQRDPKCPYLFQHRGKRLRNIRTGFEKACIDAGYPDVIFHDTRRSAVRRMEDARIPRREAMQITGHLTENVYKRYDIGTEGGAIEAGRKLREHEQAKFANEFANKSTGANAQKQSISPRKRLN